MQLKKIFGVLQGQRNTTWMVNFKNCNEWKKPSMSNSTSLGFFKGPNKKALTVKLGKKNIIVYMIT